MKASCEESKIIFGGFRVAGVDPRGNMVQKRSKYLKFSTQAVGVSSFVKAKAGRHKAEIFNVMNGTHVDFQLDTIDDLTEDTVITKLKQVQGAHQPQSYEF